MTKQTTPRLILRTCRPDLTSHGGYQWKTEGVNIAKDWNPEPKCGGGLHGLLNGQGDASLLDWSPDAVWIVAKPGRQLVDIDGAKVKYQRATVVYHGDRAGALAALRAAGVTDPLPGDIVTAGDYGQATAGDLGQATAGFKGQATAGDYGQATAGDYGQATAGFKGQATAGHYGQATAGDEGQATAGFGGQATAGDEGQATAGFKGQATAGDYGQATAGDGGQATAGFGGLITIKWWHGHRYRLVVGYVGEDGIKPDVAYRCDNNGRLVPA
jgi:hypothetical protein